MPASCPYCGATLNFGLKFCVVCGRHTSASDMSKMGGGLKGGIRQQDMTRSLDENLGASDFAKARKSTPFGRHFKSLSEMAVYLFIGVALFFCAVRFTVQTWFPHRIHSVLAPILGKHAATVEQTITGEPAAEEESTTAEPKKEAEEQAPPPQGKKKKHGKRHHKSP